MLIESGKYKIYLEPEELVSVLRKESGLDILRNGKPSGDNLMVTCPFHKEGQERKPSFGISTYNGLCHCLACGWSGTLPQLVSAVFGYDDYGVYGEKWLARTFRGLKAITRKPLIIAERSKISQRSQRVPGFTEEELQKYRWVHPYMYKRGLTDGIISEFDIGYDRITDCITFPVYDDGGFPCFIARRSVRGKFFNYPSGAEKPVWCSERFSQGVYDYAVICESFFNSLTCWRYGLPSMALMGTGNSHQYSILRKLPVREYILALDPDSAGRRGTLKLRQALERFKLVTEFIIPEGKDINDLGAGVLDLQKVF